MPENSCTRVNLPKPGYGVSGNSGPPAGPARGWRLAGLSRECSCIERYVLLATSFASLPTTVSGAFYATSSRTSHPPESGCVRTPSSRNNLALQDHTGTLGNVPGRSGSGRRRTARLRAWEDKDQQLTLDHLANASVQGLVATGPRQGRRVLRLGGTGEDAEAAIIGKRCAEVAGFNVHANVSVGANDRDGLEHLCRYLARPPIANDRLQELPDGRLALRFKQAWRDGTIHIVFTPQELIEKLIPLIPRPRLSDICVDAIR
jgi:hypothetical protein